MKKLRCDKPYDLDEARKKKGLPRRKRKDSRTTAYELTIRIPEEYRECLGGKKKFTRTAFALNKKEDLKSQIEAFEYERNAELEEKLGQREVEQQDESPRKEKGSRSTESIGDYAERYVDIRSNGSIREETQRNERNYLRYVKASIGSIAICDLTSADIEFCVLQVPILSEKWAKEKRAAREANRKAADWCKRSHRKLKPLAPIRVAGPDLQAKVLKFLREVLNYACEKEDIQKNVAKAKFLTRLFKKSKPLIDPLMPDEAARFLKAVELLPVGFLKVALLLLLNTGMRPEEMQAVRPGNFIFDDAEPVVNITSVVEGKGAKIVDYPKSDASRRSIPLDLFTAEVVKQWIAMKRQMMEENGLRFTMGTPLIGPLDTPYTYRTFHTYWENFCKKAGFGDIRPYALRHTFATLNLANGENIKTVSVLLGHKSSAYTLDLYAGYVPMTGVGLGIRYMNFLRSYDIAA